MKTLFAALACVLSSVALAAPPPAPTLSVAVTDIRQLEFAWDPVPGAQSYELWYLPVPGAQWVKYRDQSARRAPLFRVGVAVHLIDWWQARFYIKACNYGGCSDSNEVGINGLQLDAIGFVKPNSPRSNRYFGNAVAVSEDGRTFAAVSAESIGTETFSATVHVYGKTAPVAGWRRQARLVPSVVQSDTSALSTADRLAISGDGNVIALGLSSETVGAAPYAGAVYVFRRDGDTWSEAQKITGSAESDAYGIAVKLDESGRTLAILRTQLPNMFGQRRPGVVDIYRDGENDGSDHFVLIATSLVPPNPYDPNDSLTCPFIALSGDGETLLRSCTWDRLAQHFAQVLNAPTWSESGRISPARGGGVSLNYDGTVAATESPGIASVWRLTPVGWGADGVLDASFQRVTDWGNRHVTLSRDGKLLALGIASNYTLGLGPINPPFAGGPSSQQTGAVALFERKPSGWRMRRLIKSDSTNRGMFGHAVALGDNGRILAVGAPIDPSAATGIDGDRDDSSSPQRGAVWLY